jgi:glycosyltransferase involved in cell wall biosynthesis
VSDEVRTVVHYTDTAGFGGAERMLLTMLAGLAGSEWRSVLLVHDAGDIEPLVTEARALGVTVRRVPRLTRRRGIVRLPAFMRELARLRPAVFHAHLVWPLRCTHGLIGAFLLGVPTVASQQLYVQLPSRHGALTEKLVSLVVRRYLAVSRHVRQQMQERVLLPHRVLVVPNAVPIPRGSPLASAHVREQLPGKAPTAVVLTLARLDEQKGLLTLVRAAASVADARFMIAGEGPQRSQLEESIRSLGLQDRVFLLGQRSDVTDLLGACDVFVLPSLFEGLPVSLLEAMAAGKAVVATGIGGTDEIVQHEHTGLLVPAGDDASLAAAIRRMLSDPVFAQRMAAAGRERVAREYSADVLNARLRTVYSELAPPSTHRAPARVHAS